VHNRTKSSARRPVRRRLVAAGAILATVLSLAVTPTLVSASAQPLSAPKPPPKPTVQQYTQAQIEQALRSKQGAAALVGQLSGQVAAKQVEVQQLTAKLQHSEQVMALRVSQQQIAEQNAAKAKKALATATAKVGSVRRDYVAAIRAAYSGSDDDSVGDTAGALLTATDPTDLLLKSTLAAYQARHQSNAVDQMQQAEVAQSNAEAKARLATAKAKTAATAAKKAVASTAALYKQSEAERAQLESDLAVQQAQAAAAQQAYSSKVSANAKWASYKTAYNNYLQAKARAEAEARARAAAAAAAAAAARARAQQHSGGGGGGSSSGGGGGGGSSSPAPSGGGWTAAKGRQAANRALSELGVMYAWAGGNAYGPTRGVCAGDGAWNDCNVIGFDCSGLAMYAWGKMWVHYAATQYSQAGSYHPSTGSLMPGDLLFWSDNGAVSGIHHVAIYIGGGRMVEAPESGVPTRTASIWEYGSIDFTTRPLT